MTTIMIALLSGFLSSQQCTELSVHCMATKSDAGLVFECGLMHTDPKTGAHEIISRSSTNPTKMDRIPVTGLLATWQSGISAVLSFGDGKPT